MVCVGEITTPHGVRGLVRVRVFTEGADDLFVLAKKAGGLKDVKGQTLQLSPRGTVKDFLIAAVAGVDDRNVAEGMRGTKLFVPRDVLPETDDGEYYLSDLEGLTAQLEDGTRVGKVRAVQDFGAGPLLEIARPGAEPLLLPFTDSFVPTVDIAGGTVTVVMPVMVEGDKPESATD